MRFASDVKDILEGINKYNQSYRSSTIAKKYNSWDVKNIDIFLLREGIIARERRRKYIIINKEKLQEFLQMPEERLREMISEVIKINNRGNCAGRNAPEKRLKII